MSKNKNKYSPTIYTYNNITGTIQVRINKGLHNKIHEDTILKNFNNTKKSTNKSRKNKRNNIPYINDNYENYGTYNYNKTFVTNIKNQNVYKLIEKKKEEELKKKAELKRLRNNASGIIRRARDTGKLELFKEVYGEDLSPKTLINSQEDFDRLKYASEMITGIKRKEGKIEDLKTIVYNDEKTPDDKIIQYEKEKKVQQKKLDEIKKDIVEIRKQQKEEAIKNSNKDSVNLYKHDTNDEDLYTRVKNEDNYEKLNGILSNLQSKTLTEKLSEKTYNDVYKFLTTKYFNQVLLDRTRDKDGNPHEFNIKQRLDNLAKSFGSNYAMAQDFLNEIVSAEFRGDFDSEGTKKSDIQAFKREMWSRVERAEMRVAQMLNN